MKSNIIGHFFKSNSVNDYVKMPTDRNHYFTSMKCR